MSKADELSELATQATELVSNLETLKQRIGHFGAARDDLHSTSERLAELTAELQRLTGKTHDVLQKLDQIDAANLAAQLGALSKRLDEAHADLNARASESASKLDKAIEQQATTKRFVSLGVLLLLMILGITVWKTFW